MCEYWARNEFLGQKKENPPFQGISQINSILAEFFGSSGQTPFRGPGITVNNICRCMKERLLLLDAIALL